jgi:NADPH:quinone reductase-like Zn-dependent oxidoreductase
MRALVYDRYGRLDVLAFRDMPVPEPKRGEVLVRVHAAAFNPKDSFVRKGRFRIVSGRSFPKRVGCDVAGTVVRVGAGVVGLAPGDRVFGMLQEMTYLRGTIADFVSTKANEIGAMPASLSFEEAAALPLVSLTALQALRDVAGLRHGDALCIHGASGGVGTVAIQIAVALGAVVTTTSSASNRELCRSLGAVEALDYATDEPFAGSRRFRVVLDAFGNLSLGRVRRALTKDGIYVTTVPSLRIVRDRLLTLVGTPRARIVVVRPRRADIETIAAFVDDGRLRPVIDRVVSFDDAIEGMRHLETKRARGKIVVRMGDESQPR